jgi:hypothetical protein
MEIAMNCSAVVISAPGLQFNKVSIPYQNIPATSLRGTYDNSTLSRDGFKVVVEDVLSDEVLCNAIQYNEYADQALMRRKA